MAAKDKPVEKQLNVFTGSDRDPREYIHDALEWAAVDYPTVRGTYPAVPGRWLQFIFLCEKAKAAGLKRVRRGDVYLLAMQHGLSVSVCRAFRQDNNIWPALTRYAIMFRPSLAGVLHPNEQKWDRAGIDWVAEWHAHVNPNTPFCFDDWREAVKAFGCGDVSAL